MNDPYLKIAERFDEGTLGAPKVGEAFSEAFMDYLKLLYTSEEAALVQHLRMMKHFRTAAEVADAEDGDKGTHGQEFGGLLHHDGHDGPCSQVRGRTRWDNPHSMAPSNFVAEAGEDCVLCGTCVDRCFFGAIRLDDEAGRALVDPAKCMGCGVCTHTCPEGTMKLKGVERSEPFPGPRELYTAVARENKGADA